MVIKIVITEMFCFLLVALCSVKFVFFEETLDDNSLWNKQSGCGKCSFCATKCFRGIWLNCFTSFLFFPYMFRAQNFLKTPFFLIPPLDKAIKISQI